MVEDNLEEFEQFGAVALIGLLLLPGVAWILRAKSGGAIAVRSVVVGAVIAGAVAVEAAMDRTANVVTDGRTAA